MSWGRMFKRKQKSIKFGIVCDLHIGHNPFDERKVTMRDFVSLQADSLYHQLSEFRDRKCKHILFAGDVFDTAHPSQEMLAKLLEVLADFKEMYFYFMLGNHEIENYKTLIKEKRSIDIHSQVALIQIAKFTDRIHVFTKATQIEIEGFPVTFLPWPDTALPHGMAARGLVVMHNELYGTVGDSGYKFDKDEAATFNVDLAKKNNMFFISGHLHTQQWLHQDSSWGVYYPGRWGGNKHNTGLFDSYCTLTMTEDVKGHRYEVTAIKEEPFWDIRRIRPVNEHAFLNTVKDVNAYFTSYIIHSTDRCYIPTKAQLEQYPFVRVVDPIAKTVTETVQGITSDTTSNSYMKDYKQKYMKRFSMATFKNTFLRGRFSLLQQKVDNE